MGSFDKIKKALAYIDGHLDESLGCEQLADMFHFSPYYFHRMFSVIVGKTIAAYIRDRRLERACERLARTDQSILEICLDCGYDSAQSFSRAFRNAYGVSPSAYRRQGFAPDVSTVDELIVRFTNRLKGGVLLNPSIIRKPALTIAGVSGRGNRTGEVWERFMELNGEICLSSKASDNGYEIRLHGENGGTVHVGHAVTGSDVDPAYTVMKLPASQYASFDVYVARGYESENNAMEEWLEANKGVYAQRLLNGKPYVVEFYDERFNGAEKESVVEIWIPIEKK